MTNIEELRNRIYEINRRFSEQGERLQIAVRELEDSESETRFVMDQTSRSDVRDEVLDAILTARSQTMNAIECLVRASTALREYADSI